MSSDLPLAEPQLCQAWCQSVRERCFVRKAVAVSWGNTPMTADQEEEGQPGGSSAAGLPSGGGRNFHLRKQAEAGGRCPGA